VIQAKRDVLLQPHEGDGDENLPTETAGNGATLLARFTLPENKRPPCGGANLSSPTAHPAFDQSARRQRGLALDGWSRAAVG